MADTPSTESASLPAAYRAWRASQLGRIIDRLEGELILGLTRFGAARQFDLAAAAGQGQNSNQGLTL